MDISPNALRKEAAQTLRAIEGQLFEVTTNQNLSILERAQMRTSLLLAKATSINTLVLLQEKK